MSNFVTIQDTFLDASKISRMTKESGRLYLCVDGSNTYINFESSEKRDEAFDQIVSKINQLSIINNHET